MAKNSRFWHKKWLHFAPARISAERTLEVLIRGHLGPPKKSSRGILFFWKLWIEKYVRLVSDRTPTIIPIILLRFFFVFICQGKQVVRQSDWHRLSVMPLNLKNCYPWSASCSYDFLAYFKPFWPLYASAHSPILIPIGSCDNVYSICYLCLE